jgi:hypothetical protein
VNILLLDVHPHKKRSNSTTCKKNEVAFKITIRSKLSFDQSHTQ